MFNQDKGKTMQKQTSEQTNADDNTTSYACHRVRAVRGHHFLSNHSLNRMAVVLLWVPVMVPVLMSMA